MRFVAILFALAVFSYEAAATSVISSYFVFFHADSATLVYDAERRIGDAAARLRYGDIQALEVEGHTDRAEASGSGLSMKRAEAVKNALLAKGVSANMISTKAYGANKPLVPTENGVKEPQNRRVEIKLIFK